MLVGYHRYSFSFLPGQGGLSSCPMFDAHLSVVITRYG
jgi:hypothetical protein